MGIMTCTCTCYILPIKQDTMMVVTMMVMPVAFVAEFCCAEIKSRH